MASRHLQVEFWPLDSSIKSAISSGFAVLARRSSAEQCAGADDWAVCLTCAHGREHAQGSAGDAVHVGQGEGDIDADGDDEAGDDGGLVAQRQAKDDVSGSASAAGVGHILRRAKMMGQLWIYRAT